MHLKKIKLVGFKSFVDITTIPFANEMTAIVGPNGCGKSNIIDAVRWVLGESSAKNLRGDSMTDVIFNGATSRKPVGQASVELLFDNTQSRVQGSMADRNEISIRRVVNRDSQNSYFLNGSKCRRKDITDIFLGTGLGPRSYAIIEQGMISKLIESKPHELRVFIEEAAGVSKYKERRRETETRITKTRENLVRLADIKQELREQLDKLHAQSMAANQFRTLKKQERLLKAQLIAFRWQQCQQKVATLKLQQLELTKDVEIIAAEQASLQLESLKVRAEQDEHNDALALLQKQQLQLTRDITRLEQNIQHAKQSNVNLELSLKEALDSKNKLTSHIEQQTETLANLLNQIDRLEPQVIDVSAQLSGLNSALKDIQHRQRAWQEHWDKHQQSQAEHTKKTSVNASRLIAANSVIDSSTTRIDELKSQMQQTITTEQMAKKQQLENQLNTTSTDIKQCAADLAQLTKAEQQQLQDLSKVKKNQQHLDLLNQQEQAQRSALQSLLSQQSSAQKSQQQYLQSQGFVAEQTLLQALTVDVKWQLAVEMVIGQWLNANVVDQWPDDFPLESGQLIKLNGVQPIEAIPGTLAEQVSNDHPFTALLNSIYLADNEIECKQLSDNLRAGQSVICPQGYWYAKNWFRKGLEGDQQHKLAQRIQVDDLNNSLANRKGEYQEIANQVNSYNQQLQIVSDKKHALQSKHGVLCTRQRSEEQQVALLTQEITLQNQQHQRYKDEYLKLEKTLAEQVIEYEALLKEQRNLQQSPVINNQDGGELHQQRNLMNEQQDVLQGKISDTNQQLQALTIECEQVKAQRHNIDNNLDREQRQLSELDARYQTLQQSMNNSAQPLNTEEQQLTQLLRENVLLDNSIIEQHQWLSNANEQLENFEQTLKKLQYRHNQKNESLNKKQLSVETLQIKSQNLVEQLAETQFALKDVVSELPKDIVESQWQIKLERINKEVNQLGPINLAAINEFDTQQERFNYLERQTSDLEVALKTLETAIKKIDSESREKFKNTFDKVNADLKKLFPKVFGGGSAYLDLTGEDFLDTGVTIMARPPGKKNSTIGLLSGGEKALTALSLVFAIFRLNPAPFCMLDEVDAPLDDANVGRFCNLVKEMSQTVQFIYISHNKIAMEMASHLTGVTMFEPGVSRMVAVDIDDAIAMAEEY